MCKTELRNKKEHFGAVNLVLHILVEMSNKQRCRPKEVRGNKSFKVSKGIEIKNGEYSHVFQLILTTPLQQQGS